MLSTVKMLSISLLLSSSVVLAAGLDLKKKGVSIDFLDPNEEKVSVVLKRIHDEGIYDFSSAKTMVLFCNGIWCPQSSWAIQNLIKIGYPKEKLKWYRGGMYSWTSVNLTTIIPE
ncbi:MAG: hypothetical protein U9N30_05260 [Campylobacterota bacterium]|nr:hypothetical protein [Campylobacterota bacterium]